jgi:magnesium-transporting ATPase (P-type)
MTIPKRDSTPETQSRWHAMHAGAVLSAFEVDADRGLDDAAVERHRRKWGSNVLPVVRRRGPALRFLLQFHNVLIYLLLVTAAITVWLGDHVDAAVILAVVLVNALIGFIQEGNAERALDAISALLPLHAIVLRARQKVGLAAAQLVPGDIVFLASGDKVPADLRLIAARSLRIDESALTGESVAADKHADPVVQAADLGARYCIAYSGTLVRHGTGTGVVVATGGTTEIGRINALLGSIEPLATPLLEKMAALGRWITGTVLLIAGSLFAVGTMLRGYSSSEMFSAAVGLAVAAVPEGLPAVLSITLAIGVRRMASRRAIIRRLPAVEALGAATVICTDKTGTLTRNEMAVQQVITADGEVAVTAEGYAPIGAFSADGLRIDPCGRSGLGDIARASLLCNDAQLRCVDGVWELSGDPTEGALLTLALKAGLDGSVERAALPRIDVIPFESEHGFMATLNGSGDAERCIFLKGAPERVLPMCGAARKAGADIALAHADWEGPMAAAASQGMRLIAVAVRTEPQGCKQLDMPMLRAGGFTLLGVLAMVDPPRAEAVAAVQTCLCAGIRVKMITGDHAVTASAIGEQLGFPPPVRSMTGAQIDTMDDAQLDAALAVTDVFARAAPEHKLRLVAALQRGGEVVVMTGDGVNDAPALKCADVGVAMGHKGTEAAKDAAEMVLADDNFATLAAAVEEGRVVYDNIRKTIVFTLPTNGGEAGILILAIMFGLTLPITPVQILWVNMITEVTLSLALAFEKPESDVMQRPPRDPQEPLVTGLLLWRIGFVSVLMVGGCMGLYLWEVGQGSSLAQARTVVVNALVVGHVAYLFNTRRLTASALTWEGWTGNRLALAAALLAMACQMVLTYWAPAQSWFGTAALHWQAWARVGGFGVALLLLVELEKAWRRRRA